MEAGMLLVTYFCLSSSLVKVVLCSQTFLLPSLILQVVLKYEYCSELIKMLIFRYQTLHLLFIIRIIWDMAHSKAV